MIITGNCGRTQPAKRAVTPWAQGPTTRAPAGQPRSLEGPQHTARRYPAVPGYLKGWLDPRRLLGWLAGLYSIQTLYWVPDLWALGSLGTRRTCSHLNIFLNYLCFILTFLWNSYSLTPWFFADSRISRQRLAEWFVGHGRDCGWEQSVVERMVLLADIIPIILYHFQWLSKENIILSTYWVKWQEVTRTFSRSLSWLRITGSGWVDLTLSCYYQHDTFMPSR